MQQLLQYSCVCAALAISTAAQAASTPNYPNRPVRMITSAAGGSSDFAARLVSYSASPGLGQQLIIDNRGGGVQAIEIVTRASPDGYTLLYYGSILWLLPMLQDGVPYDTLRDLIPVAQVVSSPVILTVTGSLPAKSVKELIALAKAKPAALNYGSGGSGSTGHLAMELFKYMTGTDLVRIPFKGSGPALNALLSGEVQVLMASAGGMDTYVKAGKIRALAVTGAKRSPSYPELPTMIEAGVPGYEYGQMSGVFAPAKTPAAIVSKLNRDISNGVNQPDYKQKFLSSGQEPTTGSPQEFAAKIKAEIARLGKVIKAAKIRAE